MATRKKKLPELELPGKIVEAVTAYIGPRTLNKLSSEQRSLIMAEASECARSIGGILAGDVHALPDADEETDQEKFRRRMGGHA